MSQSPISLIAFDLDGTVFGSPTNQVVSPRVCAAFQAAHDAGVLITVASGRPFWMLGTQIPAAPWLDFAISCNGARVAGTRRCDLDFAASFPRALAEDTLAAIAELGGTVSIHTDAESLMETRHCAHLLDDFGERKAERRRCRRRRPRKPHRRASIHLRRGRRGLRTRRLSRPPRPAARQG